jgi:multidrug efflux pump subunit AcrA (membrane-fusion protein)
MRFRGQALRQLEAPEQLDEVVRLATIPGWLLTITLVAVGVSAALWATFGTVASTVQANGVLIHSDGISTLDATVSGQVAKVWATPNEQLSAGTPLYTIVNAAGQQTTVDAPWSAYVTSLQISVGQLLGPGTPVAELEPLNMPGEVLEAVVFIPANFAATLAAGNPVQVSTPEAPRAVFGTLQGTVSSVGAFPETVASLQAFLGSGYNVMPLLRGGSVVRVVIPLATVPGSATTLRWSRQAPPYRIDSESPVSVSFTLARQHPIDWLLGRS